MMRLQGLTNFQKKRPAIFNISLVETRKGNFSVRVEREDGAINTLHSLYDPEAEARAIVDRFHFDGKGILIVLGSGLGYHVIELMRRFPEAEIVVVESSSEIYELAAANNKIDGHGNRIRFIVGRPQEEVIEKITRLQIGRGMPPISFFSFLPAVSAFPQYYEPILARLEVATSLKIWERLRYPKFREDSLRVAVIDFGYFLDQEIKRGIESLGHRVIGVKGKKEESAGDIIGRMIRAIVESKPDFLLTVNHLGFDEEGVLTSFLNSIEMPVASWYVDNPNIIVKGFDRNVSPYVSIFLWDRSFMKDIEGMGFESVEYLPLGTDEEVFRPVRLNPSDVERYGSDISFVGNSWRQRIEEELSGIPEELHPTIEKIASTLSNLRMPFAEGLKTLSEREIEKVNSLTINQRLDFEAAAYWKATLHYRLSCIRALKEFHPVIYGDKHWGELLGSGYRLKSPVNYYKELPLAYNACKINFNATSLQMLEAVNQRVFDVPASGGFLITDHQDAIEDLFEVGKEVVTYKDTGEIQELVRFYLKHPEFRIKIANRGRERVLKEHTYKHRISEIIRIMKERYAA